MLISVKGRSRAVKAARTWRQYVQPSLLNTVMRPMAAVVMNE